MNKNQKRVPYSFLKLIYGNNTVIAYHQRIVDKLSKQIAKAKLNGKDTTEFTQNLNYHKSQLAYFREENERYYLAMRVCGNETVLVK